MSVNIGSSARTVSARLAFVGKELVGRTLARRIETTRVLTKIHVGTKIIYNEPKHGRTRFSVPTRP